MGTVSCHDGSVVTYEQTRNQAQCLPDESPDRPYVIAGHQEFSTGSVFFYDFRQYQESGSVLEVLGGNAPIFIDRDTGQVHVTGTARPVVRSRWMPGSWLCLFWFVTGWGFVMPGILICWSVHVITRGKRDRC